jgi:hypothetical protein
LQIQGAKLPYSTKLARVLGLIWGSVIGRSALALWFAIHKVAPNLFHWQSSGRSSIAFSEGIHRSVVSRD